MDANARGGIHRFACIRGQFVFCVPGLGIFRLSRIVEKTSGSATSWQLPVSRVVIGPSRHKSLNRASGAMLLASNGFNCPIGVEMSQTP